MKRNILAAISGLLCVCLLAGCNGSGEPSAAASVIGTTDTLVAQEDLTPKDNGKAAGYQLGRKSP